MISITLTAEQVALVVAQAGVPVPEPVPTPEPAPAPVPVPVPAPADAIWLGELAFDGSRVVTSGVIGGHLVYATVIIPASQHGMHATISVYEYIDGQRSRKIWLSKTPDGRPDYPAYGIGSSAHLTLIYGASSPSATTVQAGEVLYLHVAFERENGQPSLGYNESCNFAITAYPFN